MGRAGRAGDRATPRRGSCSTRRCRRRLREGQAFFEKYPAAAKDLPARRQDAEAGRRFVNKRLRDDAARDRERGRRRVLSRRDRRRIADDMAKNGGLITARRSRAVPRDRAAAARRAATATTSVYSAPPPVSTGAAADRDAADPCRTTSRRPAHGYAADADYLHYAIEGVEGARSVRRGSRIRRSGRSISARTSSRRTPRAVQADRSDEGLARSRSSPLRAGRARADRPRHDGVRRGGRRRQHDRGDADAEHVGRHVLRVGGLGFLYNNHLRSAAARRPGRFLPLTRSSSTSVPTLVFRAIGRRTARRAAAGGGGGRQRVDPRVGLRHHPERGRRRHDGAARDRSAAVPDRPRPGRPRPSRMQIEDRIPARRSCRT